MAWQNPKTDWSAADGVRDTDINRIEGNALFLYEETARANKTIYVSNTGDDTTGNGTSANPFKTITEALSRLPKNLNGLNVYLHIASGTYNEAVKVSGFTGGAIKFIGTASNVEVTSLTVDGCMLSISSLTLNVTAAVGLIVTNGGYVHTTGDIIAESASTGVNVNNGSVLHVTGTLSCPSAANAVSCAGCSSLYANSITGIGILNATTGGTIAFGNSTLSRYTASGGRINSGSQSSSGGSGVLPSTVE